ncbi:uncharacterized protein At3g27210-like isoform X2 [Amaranthus tricolor]|uniref:uncharacterized protein At3g27210-like isoform X2 n=1 Tax=Amaranthus tricolor TaxID=29722 RepID=UPI00258A29E5|nr:uncharacterized protein At3g27210-like isoform X2 [Amaranthus tricolor]
MKNMKRVFMYFGCVSTKTSEPSDNLTNTLELNKALKTVQSPVCKPPGSKEEAFYDSKPWLDSDDEQDFYSVNGDIPAASYKVGTLKKDGEEQVQGRKLSELFKDSSFRSDSLKAAHCE